MSEAFKAQDFGTLTEIDVQATLKDKLGEGIEPYVVLGTCNPTLARQVLDVTRDIGLLLRATWSYAKTGTASSSRRSTPLSSRRCPAFPLEPIAAEASARIQAALDVLGGVG